MSNEHNNAPFRLILVVLALVFWAFAAFPYAWGPEPWPWRERFIAAGLFCYGLSTFF
jgi:hypothetical protein